MASNNMTEVLKYLGLSQEGRFENHFYIIQLEDSDEYAKMYSHLGKVATNTEYPNFGVNTNKTTTLITNYFEVMVDNVDYNIFLFADFDKDSYYIKIGSRK